MNNRYANAGPKAEQTRRGAMAVMETCANAIPNELWSGRLTEASATVERLADAAEPFRSYPAILQATAEQIERLDAALAAFRGEA